VYEAVRARVALSEQVKATLRALESCAKGKLPGVPGKDDLAPNGATLESLRDRTAEALKELGDEEAAAADERARDAAAAEGGAAMAVDGEEGEVDGDGAPRGVRIATERDAAEAGRVFHRYFRAVVCKGQWQIQADIEVRPSRSTRDFRVHRGDYIARATQEPPVLAAAACPVSTGEGTRRIHLVLGRDETCPVSMGG